jgi:hypothetical protein
VSDQYGNKVDGEIWIDQVVQYGTEDGSQKPKPVLRTATEYGIAYSDGRVDDILYDSESEARSELVYKRRWLEKLSIPEEYWPVLMERTVETIASSWRILDV